MIYKQTPLRDAHVIELEKRADERGFFARVFCEQEFTKQGLVDRFVQVNDSFASTKGTLRGLHYQLPPHAEVKLVRCIRGALYDVILDVRKESPSFGRHFGVELTAKNRKMLYVPTGFAHGFITLEDDTEVFYFASSAYAPDFERGVRWNDPSFEIRWPLEPTVMSEKDRNLPDFDPTRHPEV
jgi:dTDP-4-dehydrorhamnose 3,5-epimerase